MKKSFTKLTALLIATTLSTSLMATDYVVSGAGTTAVNGTYLEDIVVNGKTSYKYAGTTTYYLFYQDSYWYIHDKTSPSDPTDSFYYIESSADEPPTSGWASGSYGVGDSPTLTESQTYSLDFDGSDDYVDLGTSSDLKPTAALTVEVWANADNWQSETTGKLVSNTHVGGYDLSIRDAGITFTVYSDGVYRQPQFSNSGYSGWHHIAGTFDGQYAKLYIDGILKNTVDMGTSGNAITYGYPNNSTLLGAEAGTGSTPTGNYLDGKIDEVRIWDVARTQAEIQEYICEDVSSESNLIAYYRMSNGSGTSLIDNSSTSYTGTLYDGGSVGNGPTWQTDYLVPEGAGTSGDKYQIQTLNHLWWLSQNSDEWGKLFEQTADIDMTVTQNWNDDHNGDPEGFSPIGINTTYKFTGSYDGQSNTISDLIINRSGTSYIGLFGYTSGSTIQNLGVTNVNISGSQYIGALVGLFSGTITNCYTSGSVTSAGHYAGGFVGFISNNGYISNSYTTTNVNGYSRQGGFTSNANAGVTIENCYSMGDVTLASGTRPDVGSFLGYDNSGAGTDIIINNCYATGNVFFSGENPTDRGFVGDENGGNFTNNFFDSGVSNQTSATGATAKTTAEMKDVATFTDEATAGLTTAWDFIGNPNDDTGTDNYWSIDGSNNSGYPWLTWEDNDPVTNTWDGSASAYWNNKDNWSLDFIPSVQNNISISSGVTQPIISATGTASCNNLTVNGGASLTISSTSSSTGSLIVNGTASGDVIIQRYIAAATWTDWEDGWHFLSSPVADYAIQDNFTVSPTNEYDFYAWSETNNIWVNFKNTGSSPTFLEVNGSNTFELGYGYMAAYKSTDTKDFTGTINVGDVSISNLDVTGSVNYYSWHLLGNPFTSALTWYTDWTTTSISGTAKIWNEENKSYTSLSGGDPIPATNGFMVQATADDASLTIPASKRIHNSQAFYKTSRYEYPIIKLKANNIDNPSAQESEIRFNPESTNEWDMEFDSDFLAGYAPLFYSLIDGNPMAVNSLPDYSESTVIPFTFIKNEGLNFSIKMYEIENMDLDVYLFDKKTNNEHNLSQNPVYTFTSFQGDDFERFEIRFKTVGIEEPSANSNIQIWSANKTINILNPDHQKGTIRIINMYGQLLIETQLNGNEKQEISVNLTVGNYIVNVINDKRVISKKVFVK